MVTPTQLDPTRTITLQKKLLRVMLRRLRILKWDIVDLVVTEDAFGLKKGFPNELVSSFAKSFDNGGVTNLKYREFSLNTRWAFRENAEKVEEFRKWLAAQLQFRLMGATAEQIERAFWHQYIQEGFLKGAGRAFESVRGKPVLDGRLDFYEGSKAEFLRESFANPQTIDKVKMLSGRVFTELKGVTDAMAVQMQRTLVDGFVQGKGPRAIAKDLTRAVQDIGYKRATVIARTEIVRTYNEGQLNSLERLGVEEVGVAPEWSTAKDGRVCPLCRPMEGVVFKIKEARGMLPRHPNCRCAFIPSGLGESQADKNVRFAGEFWSKADLKTKRSRADVQKAIDKSIRAERPTSKSTLAKQKSHSKWVGAGKSISKKRPKPIIDGK